MADAGKISRARMEAYADQARRLGNVSGDLSPAQIESTLKGITLGRGNINFSSYAVATNLQYEKSKAVSSGLNFSVLAFDTAAI